MCNQEERSGQAGDDQRDGDRRNAVNNLHEKIIIGADAEDALWQAVIAYQGCLLYTSSGLPFRYEVKRNRAGAYSGELVVSRKEGSKTLTRSSVMLAFRRVEKKIGIENIKEKDGSPASAIVPPKYKGPKAIGQIFGISYVYSLFWRLGLIKAPAQIEEKLRGEK